MMRTLFSKKVEKIAWPRNRRYESDLAVSQYCDPHYGPDKFGVTNFPLKLAQLSIA